MPKFLVCPECLGSGSSSAYLGAFTGDDIAQMDDEFMEDYFAGNFDRKCDNCNGQRVVAGCKIDNCQNERAQIRGYFGTTNYDECFEHSTDAQESAESESQHRAEIAFGC